MKLLFPVILALLTFDACTVEDESFYKDSYLSFQHTIKVNAEKRSYVVGDTIEFSAQNEDSVLFDRKTAKPVSIAGKRVRCNFKLVDVNQRNIWKENSIFLRKNDSINEADVRFSFDSNKFIDPDFYNFADIYVEFGCDGKSAQYEFVFEFLLPGLYYLLPENREGHENYSPDYFNDCKGIGFSSDLPRYLNYFIFEAHQSYEDFDPFINRDAKIKAHLKKLTDNRHIYWIKVD